MTLDSYGGRKWRLNILLVLKNMQLSNSVVFNKKMFDGIFYFILFYSSVGILSREYTFVEISVFLQKNN